MDRKDNKGNENRAKKHRSKKNQQSHGTKRRGNHNRDGDTGTANPNNDGGKAKKSKRNGTVTGHFSTHRQQSQQCAIGEEVVIGTTLTLKWERPFRPVSIEAEEQLLPLLLRYAEKERGMMKSHHPRRVQSIRDACREIHMTLDQALSMRRMHMMYLNQQISNTFQLHLGRPKMCVGLLHYLNIPWHNICCARGYVSCRKNSKRLRLGLERKLLPLPTFYSRNLCICIWCVIVVTQHINPNTTNPSPSH